MTIFAPFPRARDSSLTVIDPFASQYFTALSSRMETICCRPRLSPLMRISGAISTVKRFPSFSATLRKGSELSAATAERSTSVSSDSFISSSRVSTTKSSISVWSRLICLRVLSVHLLLPPSTSVISVFADMTARGVFSSWLALVMKRFCFSSFSMNGWISFFEKCPMTMTYRISTVSHSANIYIMTSRTRP